MESKLEADARYILMHLDDARRLLIDSGLALWRLDGDRITEIMNDFALLASSLSVDGKTGDNQR